MELQITTMRAEHIPEIAALERECFSDPWSERSFLEELDNPLSCWYVAVAEGRVAGYVGAQTVLDESDVMNLAVHPDYRRQGLGHVLMEQLQQTLVRQGVILLALEVRASNEPAKRLYSALGFQLAGRRPNYYFKPKEDALILKKRLEAV